jgi:hypothetical protein
MPNPFDLAEAELANAPSNPFDLAERQLNGEAPEPFGAGLTSGDPVQIANAQMGVAAKVQHLTKLGLSVGDMVNSERQAQEERNRQMPSLNPQPSFGPTQFSREMQPKQPIPTDEQLGARADEREQAQRAEVMRAATESHPFNKIASVVGPFVHGGITLSERVAQDWADDTAALLRGEPLPASKGGGLHIPGLRNVSAFANNPQAPSPSEQENETIGGGMRALQSFGQMGATLPAFTGEMIAGGPLALPAIMGTTPGGEVDPVGMVAGLTIGRVHEGAANWIKSKFFADTVTKLAPEEMRAMYQRFAAGQATAADQELMTAINGLKSKEQSLRDLQRLGGTITKPWAETPTQAQLAHVASQLGGIGAANGYFLTLQMPQILSSEDPKQALLEAVAGLAAASAPGLAGLAGKPGGFGKGTLDINGKPAEAPGQTTTAPKSGRLQLPEAKPPANPFDIAESELSSTPQAPESASVSSLTGKNQTPGAVTAADTAPGASSSPLPGAPNLVNSALSGALQTIGASKAETERRAEIRAAGKPYTTEQALADLPSVVQDLKAALEGNRLKAAPSPMPGVDPKPANSETGLATEAQSAPSQETGESLDFVAPETPAATKIEIKNGDTVSVVTRAGAKPRAARVVQVQPDGSAQVVVKGEQTARWLTKAQIVPSRRAVTQQAKADELAGFAPEQQTQIKQRAAEFRQLVEDYAPQLEWTPAEAYDESFGTDTKDVGFRKAELRTNAIRQAMRAVFPNGQENSQVDQANALPRLERYLKEKFPGDNSVAQRRALEQFGRADETAAPTTVEQRARAKQDIAHLRRIAAQNARVPELQSLSVHVPTRSSSGQTGSGHARKASRPLSAAELKGIRELERLFGVRIILVDHPRGNVFHGYKERGSNVILLNAESPLPALTVAGHELGHHIQLTHPGLYQDMADALIPLMQNVEQYRAALARKGYQDRRTGRVEDATLYSEIINDFLGDNFGRKEFWEDLKRREPNLFKRLARIVKAWLDKLIAKLKGAKPKGFESEQYFSDLEQARAVVANALVQAGRETQYRAAGVPEGKAAEPQSAQSGEFSKSQGNTGIRYFDKAIKTPYGSRYYHLTYNGDWFRVRLADHSYQSSNMDGGAGTENLFRKSRAQQAGVGMDNPHFLNVLLKEPVKTEVEAKQIIARVIRGLPEGAAYRIPLWEGTPTAEVSGNDDIHVDARGETYLYEFPPEDGARRYDVPENKRASQGEKSVSGDSQENVLGSGSTKTGEQSSPQSTATDKSGSLRKGQEVSDQAAPGQFSRKDADQGGFFDAPENVEEQRARLRDEAETQKLKKAKETMQERAGARLVSTEDTRTQDMFATPEGRTTRQDKAGQGSLFSKPEKETGPLWRSNIQDALTSWQNKGTPEQLRAHLAKTRGAMDEAEWIGLDDFLKDKPSVTKQQVQEFVKANTVDVQEVEQSDKPPMTERERLAERDRIAQEKYGKPFDELESGQRFYVENDVNAETRNNTKFSQYQLPGGENYRELLLTLPDSGKEQASAQVEQIRKTIQDDISKNPELIRLQNKLKEAHKHAALSEDDTPAPGYDKEKLLETWMQNQPFFLSGRGNKDNMRKTFNTWSWREYASDLETYWGSELQKAFGDRYAEIEKLKRTAEGGNQFKSSHFDEPNILAHVRFNERTDADGKKVLFIEEVQSDWHQKGRKEGYAGESPAAAAESDIELKRIERTPDQNPKIYPGYWESFDKRDGRMIMRHGGDMSRQEAMKEAVQYAHYHAQQEASKSVPNAPFKQTWPMLAMKRMIRYASENGFDRIAWTTGEQQAERYDLSKQIGSVHYNEATQSLTAYKPSESEGAYNGGQAFQAIVPPDKIADYIGKDPAEKLLAASPQANGVKRISGLDLKVGGEGMRGFYDKILPGEVNKFVKKWGGRVGLRDISVKDPDVASSPWTVTQPNGMKIPFANESAAKRHIEQYGGVIGEPSVIVHSLDITPAIKEAALQGMPLFSKPEGEGELPAWVGMRNRIKQAEADLKEAIRTAGNTDLRRAAGLSITAAKNLKNLATARLREAQEQLRTDPGWVEYLMGRTKQIQQEINALKTVPKAEQDRKQLAELESEFETLNYHLSEVPKKLVSKIYDAKFMAGDERTEREKQAGSEAPGTSGRAANVGDSGEIGRETQAARVRVAISNFPASLRSAKREAADATRKLANLWSARRNRDMMAATFDAAENGGSLFGKQAANEVLHLLNRNFRAEKVDARNTLREAALTFVIESGQDETTLAEFREQIRNSDFADSKAGKLALAAIDFAENHWERLTPVADLYNQITDAQVDHEQAAGVETLHRKGGYVFHLTDVLASHALPDIGSAGSGVSSPFLKTREYATYADAIAAGSMPKSLNAVDLLQRRMSLGQKLINHGAWIDGMYRVIDPKSQQPIVTHTITKVRKDGKEYEDAPAGYIKMSYGPQTFAVMRGYDGLFKSLVTPSTVRNSLAGNVLMNAAGGIKHSMLLFDSYHLGRLMFWSAMVRGMGLPGNPFSHRQGLTLLDNTGPEIERMAANGEIPQEWVADLKESKRQLALLVANGLNVAGVADNIAPHFVQELPLVGTFNKFLFQKYQRGATAEAALIELRRQIKQQPGRSEAELAREVARDLNVRFGNLQNQSWIKNKNIADLLRMVFLAPQWNESLIRSELGAVGELADSAKGATIGDKQADGTRKRSFHMGALGRAVITAVIGQFIANQIINYITRGKPTWENPEETDAAKLSAYIPDVVGNGPGYFLNPLTLPAEISELLMKKTERTGDFTQAAKQFLASRLGPLGRIPYTLAVREDELGAKLRTGGDVAEQMASSLIPLPISAGAIYRGVKQFVTGQPEEQYPGQFQKQIFQTFGIKLDSAPSPDQRVRALATEYNRDHGVTPSAEFFHGDFYDLDRAAIVGNQRDMKEALQRVLEKKTKDDIRKHYERWMRAPFTGQQARETEFKKTLDAEQLQQYEQARAKRRELRNAILKMVSGTPSGAAK